MQITDAVRSAFDERYIPEPNSGCWLWTGNWFPKRGGYGAFTVRPAGIRLMRAHRAAWMIYRDPTLSENAHVLHKCDTPLCVNPDHLFIGDQPTKHGR